MVDRTDLPLNSNISKTVKVNIALSGTSIKEYLVSFLMISRLTSFALVFLWLLMINVCGIIGISKIEFFNFSGTEKVKLHYPSLQFNFISPSGHYIHALCKKCPYSEFFWSVFPLIYEINLRIQSKCGKIRTRKALNTDTFRAVRAIDK